MLKSTHKSARVSAPLMVGWTEHKAPTGHTYYYNAETKESTYKRPSVEAVAPVKQNQTIHEDHQTLPGILGTGNQYGYPTPFSNQRFPDPNYARAQQSQWGGPNIGRGRFSGANGSYQSKPPPADRPKSKQAIPGCVPWVLVKTKLGRRFVHNPKEGVSYWKFPPEVMKAVIEFDRVERERRERNERGEESDNEQEQMIAAMALGEVSTVQPMPVARPPAETARPDEDSDDYEEVEVTDDEEESSPKRQKTEGAEESGPVEFTEDDIAYQLAAMGQEYGLDPGEYGDGNEENWEEGAEGLPLTEDDMNALFKDLLDDYHISPYKPWEKIIEQGQIIEDDRYTVLPNMKARKEVWGEWSREKIQWLKEQKEKEEKKDPRIPYLAFLQKYATPKLYWPEFRRKYQSKPEMKNTKVSDKEREKWYRDYVNRLKLAESTLRSDLTTLLTSLPLHILNRSTSMEALPPSLLTDIRYISLRPAIRDPLIEAFVATSKPVPEQSGVSPEEEAELAKQKAERKRRENALAERERKVQEEKRKQEYALRQSKGMLREGEEEVKRAMRVGREGLLSHMEVEKELDKGVDSEVVES
ncbi:MAG: hypothetical protein MMC33_004166 [Icmadophila ericetorum]|nr:hypothetical protein [Icmadophila ericetorum]